MPEGRQNCQADYFKFGRGCFNPSFVEGFSDDRAVKTGHRSQLYEVFRTGNSAAGNQVAVEEFEELFKSGIVGSFEHAVGGNVGIDDGPCAGFLGG